MSEQDNDRADLAASKMAIASAKRSAVKSDVAIASLHQTSAAIQAIVEENGYVARFRALLQGAA